MSSPSTRLPLRAGVLAAVSTVLVTAAGTPASARASWQTPLDNGGTPITGYTAQVYRGTTLVGTVPVGAGTLQVTVPGLTAGIGHSFTVRATSALGTSPASVRTMPVVPTA